MAYEQEIPGMVQQEFSVPVLLNLYQWWLSWGDYDSTGVAILERLGELAAGNPEAIAALQRAAIGNLARTSNMATYCLQRLAMAGDRLAGEALEVVQHHKQQRELTQTRFIEQRRRADEVDRHQAAEH